MSYKLLAPLCLVFVVGAVAALVKGQDLPSNAGFSQIAANEAGGGSRALRSVLVKPIGSGLEQNAEDSDPSPETSAEPVVSEPSERPVEPQEVPAEPTEQFEEDHGSSWDAPAISGPVLNNPVAPAPSSGLDREPSSVGNGLRAAQPQVLPGEADDDADASVLPAAPNVMPSDVSEQRPGDRLSARRTSINPRAIRRPLGTGVLLTSRGPSLRVETRGADAILIGKTSGFAVALINDGSTTAEGVHVRVAIPDHVQIETATSPAGPLHPQENATEQQTLDWVVAQVAPGREQVLRLELKPTENRPFDLAVDWTLRPPSATAQIAVQKPELELALFGPKDMLYGKTAVFTIQITNPGSGPAEDVSLSFTYGQRQLPAKPIGTIAAGEQTEVDVELTAAEAGALRIAAAALAAGGLRSETLQEVQVRRGRLDVQIVGSPVEFAGSTAEYRIRVKNAGDATAADVAAQVTLPQGARRISAGDSSADSAANLSFRIGSLSPGAERVFTVACELTTAGDNRIEATASGSDDLNALSAFVTQVKALADLKLLVNDPPGPMAVGDNAVFEVRVMNRGTKAAEQISVVAQFSEGIEPIEANGGAATIVPGQVLFQPIPRIAAGGEVVLKVTAQASKQGAHRFRAQVSAAEPDTRLVAEESTYFFDADSVSRTARKPE
jgi:uncharacterized repeat protein (TIGR01451 family)